MQEVSGSIPLGSTNLRRAAAETATSKRRSREDGRARYFATTFDPRAAQATQSA